MTTASDTKTCPACAEEIKFEAKKCRFCGEWLTSAASGEVPQPVATPPPSTPTARTKINSSASSSGGKPESSSGKTAAMFVALAVGGAAVAFSIRSSSTESETADAPMAHAPEPEVDEREQALQQLEALTGEKIPREPEETLEFFFTKFMGIYYPGTEFTGTCGSVYRCEMSLAMDLSTTSGIATGHVISDGEKDLEFRSVFSFAEGTGGGMWGDWQCDNARTKTSHAAFNEAGACGVINMFCTGEEVLAPVKCGRKRRKRRRRRR